MAKRSFSHFVEQEMGKIPHFVIFAVLEWVLIGLLFLDGLVFLAANRLARLVGLCAPCVLCTRIDHALAPSGSHDRDSYLNASLCDSHKAQISSIAFCGAHRALVPDPHRACDTCLLSSDKNDDRDSSADEVKRCCCCCGEALRKRATGVRAAVAVAAAAAPAPSPRGRFSMRRRGSLIRFDSEAGCDQDDKLREDLKAAMLPLLTTEPYDMNDESHRTPNFSRSGSRLFGIPLTDSASNSPRLTSRLSRKYPLGKTEFASETTNNNNDNDNNKGTTAVQNESETESVLAGPKSQVNLESKSLMELYAELEEERSASAVAANNAMAMITRLQAEKAAVQMEALQYQRMMEEQFEYDQEALEEANDLLLKREDDVSALETELEAYRERYGWLKEDDPDHDDDDDHDDDHDRHDRHGRRVTKSLKSSYSSGSLRTELGSSCLSLGEEDGNVGGGVFGESLKDFKEERTYFLGRKKLDVTEGSCENGDTSLGLNGEN